MEFEKIYNEDCLITMNQNNMNVKININKEWSFIKNEIHSEKLTSESILKREILFNLQLLLSNPSKINLHVYKETKEFYIKQW